MHSGCAICCAIYARSSMCGKAHIWFSWARLLFVLFGSAYTMYSEVKPEVGLDHCIRRRCIRVEPCYCIARYSKGNVTPRYWGVVVKRSEHFFSRIKWCNSAVQFSLFFFAPSRWLHLPLRSLVSGQRKLYTFWWCRICWDSICDPQRAAFKR